MSVGFSQRLGPLMVDVVRDLEGARFSLSEPDGNGLPGRLVYSGPVPKGMSVEARGWAITLAQLEPVSEAGGEHEL